MQQVLYREVSELERCLEDDTRLSPTCAQLHLVVGLALQVKDDIDGAVVGVGLGADVHLFGVEVSRLGNLTRRTHEVVLGEEVAGAHTQLAAHDFLIETVVTVDNHLVDASLLAFIHAHLQIDAVALDLALDGDELVEEVSVVEIEVGNGVVVLLRALVEQLLVIDVAFLDAQHIVEQCRREDGIAHPRDVGDVVTLALVNSEINVNALLVKGYNAVFHDNGIAIAFLVILVDNQLLVGLIVTLDKLLLRENLPQVSLLVGLFHRALEL